MIDDAEQERERRVKAASQLSLKMSRLPPRMEADEKLRQEKNEFEGANRAGSADMSFRPAPPRAVPDFKRIHREFAAKLERNKSAAKLTEPKPFNFHEPKLDPDLRKHMNTDNQNINPTMRKRRFARSTSAKLNPDLFAKPVVVPPSTKKHDALVALRRQMQNEKIDEKVQKQSENFVRNIKAVRLTGRVKQSPVFFNNAAQLKQKRAHSLQRFREQTAYYEDTYARQRSLMDFNVANRPLLFEQQTQEFINLYN